MHTEIHPMDERIETEENHEEKTLAEHSSAGLSITALAVARGFHRAMELEYQYLFPPIELALIKHIVDTAIEAYPLSTLTGILVKTVNLLPWSAQHSFFNMLVTPAYDYVVMLRKYMIRHRIEQAIADGTQQIIVLGGGYDIRALVTAASYPEVRVYELDRGETRQNKLNCIKMIPASIMNNQVHTISSEITQINGNLFYLDCDLAESTIEKILIPNGFDPSQKTLVLAEGLTMYLDEKNNSDLLNTVRLLFQHTESEFIASYIEKSDYGSSIQKNAHKEHGEKYQFFMNPNTIIPFFINSGLSISEKKIPTYMLADIGKQADSDYYKNNKSMQEQYFSIRPDSYKKLYESLDQIPEMNIPITVREQEEDLTTCKQM